jgi:hypothetical protein
MEYDIEKIAHVAHEANRALQIANGEDDISPTWGKAPDWQKDSAREGVRQALSGKMPEELHESWSQQKIDDGWVYGEVKDGEKKTHPCLVPYDQLPESQRLKDYVFAGVVSAFVFFARS